MENERDDEGIIEEIEITEEDIVDMFAKGMGTKPELAPSTNALAISPPEEKEPAEVVRIAHTDPEPLAQPAKAEEPVKAQPATKPAQTEPPNEHQEHNFDLSFLETRRLNFNADDVKARTDLSPEDRAFLLKLLHTAAVNPEIVDAALTVRYLLANDQSLNLIPEDAEKVLCELGMQNFPLTGLDISGIKTLPFLTVKSLGGTLNMKDAKIAGTVDIEGVTAPNDIIRDGAEIGGGIRENKIRVAGKMSEAGIRVKGKVLREDADVQGDLIDDRAQIEELIQDRIKVKGRVKQTGMRTNRLSQMGARFDSDVDRSDSHITMLQEGYARAAENIFSLNATIGDLSDSNMTVNGFYDERGATIQRASRSGLMVGSDLISSETRIRDLDLQRAVVKGKLKLRNAIVERLDKRGADIAKIDDKNATIGQILEDDFYSAAA